jgi:hypothetical protein
VNVRAARCLTSSWLDTVRCRHEYAAEGYRRRSLLRKGLRLLGTGVHLWHTLEERADSMRARGEVLLVRRALWQWERWAFRVEWFQHARGIRGYVTVLRLRGVSRCVAPNRGLDRPHVACRYAGSARASLLGNRMYATSAACARAASSLRTATTT